MFGIDDLAIGLLGGSIVGGFVDTIAGASASHDNYEMQKKVLEYQKSTQKTAWQREDNAVQRRVADLRAAGMSPVLAAGQGAQASGPIQVTAPQYNKQWSAGQAFSKADLAMQLMQAKENIAYTRAQKEYIDLQKNVLTHDYQIMQDDGMSSNPSQLPKTVRDLLAMAKKFMGVGKGNSTVDTTGETYFPMEKRDEYIQNFKEKWRADEAKKAHQKYQKEYADRQAYQSGSRKSFSR